VIRVDAVWLAVAPLDMRAGTEAALARVVGVFGAARPHHAYLFANRRANRMKVLVHDGIGVWLAARRLHSGKFVWPRDAGLDTDLEPRAVRRPRARSAVATPRRGRRHHGLVARCNCRMCRCASGASSARSRSVIAADNLDTLDETQLRQTVQRLRVELHHKSALLDKLTHEMAVLKRLKFAAKSEAYNAEQKSLIEETLDADLAALAAGIEVHQPSKAAPEDKQQPRREKLPAHLPRREVRHEPEDTTCGCGQAMKRIGEDVAEKLDHLPLYRQEAIFERAGMAMARSTLAQWVGECGVLLQPLVDALAAEMLEHRVLHADETPVAMLKPASQRDGKTHRAYLWSYCTTSFNPMKAVVFDFADSRGGQHVREFLGLTGSQHNPGWQGNSRDRRLQRLQCLLRARRHRGRLHGARTAQVPRAVGPSPKRTRRAGAEVLHPAV
jgi:transposase